MNRIKIAILGAAAIIPAASIMFASAAGPNLVSNGTFASGVAGWSNFSGNPQPFFGGMALTNDYAGKGNSYYSAYQCIKNVTPGATYTLTGQAIVPENAPEFGSASLILHFYTTDDCSGPVAGGGSASTGLTEDTRGKLMDLKVSEKAPTGAKTAWVRPTAKKEPKAPAISAPGDLVVVFDNISLTKQFALVAIPEKPGDPPPLDEPDLPADEPEAPVEPEVPVEPEAPADEPPAPADQPQGNEPAAQPAGEASASSEPASEGNETSNSEAAGDTAVNSQAIPSTNEPNTAGQPAASSAPATAPLPPETGQGEAGTDRGLFVVAACIAAMVAGLAMVVLAFRGRRAQA